MTTQEFSNEFDILYNNIMSNQAPGLDEYEKSVFLTKAQEEIIVELYNGKNVFNDSFEKTEEIRRYLSELNRTVLVSMEDKSKHLGMLESSVFFRLPEDLWFITYESANINNKDIPVIPITQDEYHRVKNNPFRGVSENRVLRLDYDDNLIELISKYTINSYFVKYLSKPTPIILKDLGEDTELKINNMSEKTECKLNSVLHRPILDRAVKLAIASFGQYR